MWRTKSTNPPGYWNLRWRTLCGAAASAACSCADLGASAVSLTTSSTTSSGATRSSVRVMVRPLLRNAISCSRRATVSKSYSVLSNTVGSARHRMLVILKPLIAVAADLHLQPAGQRVDHRHPHPMQAARDGVRIRVELAARVQLGHHHIHRGDARGVHRHRNSAAIIGDLNPTILKQPHRDPRRVAGHRLVDGVVDHLPDQMVQTPLTGRADIHAGAFTDGLQPFENGDGLGAVLRMCFLPLGSHGRTGLLGGRVRAVGHRVQVFLASLPGIAGGTDSVAAFPHTYMRREPDFSAVAAS